MQHHRAGHVAGLIEMRAFEKGSHPDRMRIGRHDRVKDEVDLECARIAVGDGVRA